MIQRYTPYHDIDTDLHPSASGELVLFSDAKADKAAAVGEKDKRIAVLTNALERMLAVFDSPFPEKGFGALTQARAALSGGEEKQC
jgi:hypothetical protein